MLTGSLPGGEHGTRAHIGPMSRATALAIAQDLTARWRLPRPVHLVDVTVEALTQDPAVHHGQIVRVTGTWTVGFESSSFAGQWFSPPEGTARPASPTFGTAVALFRNPGDGKPRYGHLGLSTSELRAFSFTPASGGG